MLQAAVCAAQAVDFDSICLCVGCSRRAAGRVVESHSHATGNDDIGHVRQIGHRATCPVGGIEPVACRTTIPGDRVQTRDVGNGSARRGNGVVASISARQ